MEWNQSNPTTWNQVQHSWNTRNWQQWICEWTLHTNVWRDCRSTRMFVDIVQKVCLLKLQYQDCILANRFRAIINFENLACGIMWNVYGAERQPFSDAMLLWLKVGWRHFPNMAPSRRLVNIGVGHVNEVQWGASEHWNKANEIAKYLFRRRWSSALLGVTSAFGTAPGMCIHQCKGSMFGMRLSEGPGVANASGFEEHIINNAHHWTYTCNKERCIPYIALVDNEVPNPGVLFCWLNACLMNRYLFVWHWRQHRMRTFT